MSNNNDSGGGCLLFLIDWIFHIRRNKKIREYNQQARGVNNFQNISASLLFPANTFKDNIMVSGGNQNERLNICKETLQNAQAANHPVIILHTANKDMENMVNNNGLGTLVNINHKLFDPFLSFDFNEIVQIITDTCKNKYDIKPPGRYILQVVYELLGVLNMNATFSNFASCPFFKLFDQIQSRLNNNAITQDTANRLNSLLITGQSELPKIDTFFSDIKSQIEYLSAPNSQSANAVSILSVIKNNQILCIDLRSSSNVMLVELIVNSLIIAMNRGLDFTLMIDDIAFVNNDLLRNVVCQKSNHHNIIVSKDLYALTGGKEDIFSTIVAEAEKTVLFAHSSNISCEKWSKYIGEYQKLDVTTNRNSGWSQSSRWGYNTNDGQTETYKREFKVKPEEINKLAPNEAFIYDHTNGSLINTIIT
ncbi:MAG: hypothetical protein FWG98_02455 [Candidatus Cloacimonetes bacterium]|nr:hypothetical protein [Candidatus Cloacimonadota bacterium]